MSTQHQFRGVHTYATYIFPPTKMILIVFLDSHTFATLNLNGFLDVIYKKQQKVQVQNCMAYTMLLAAKSYCTGFRV